MTCIIHFRLSGFFVHVIHGNEKVLQQWAAKSLFTRRMNRNQRRCRFLEVDFCAESRKASHAFLFMRCALRRAYHSTRGFVPRNVVLWSAISQAEVSCGYDRACTSQQLDHRGSNPGWNRRGCSLPGVRVYDRARISKNFTTGVRTYEGAFGGTYHQPCNRSV